jgi:hypothetical protein
MKLNPAFRYCSSPFTTLMVWLVETAFVCALFALNGRPVQAQEQPPAAEPNYEFVSGTITELPAGAIVVNRALLGKPPENRTFIINAETKIEGRLRTHARVTVGFKTTDEGDVAVRIIVRSQSKRP